MTDQPGRARRHPVDVRRNLTFGASLALALSLVGCAGSPGATQAVATQAAATQAASAAPTQAPPASGSAAPVPTSGVVGGSSASVTLSGVYAKTYTSNDVGASKAVDEVIIAIFEPGGLDTCSLSLTLPIDSRPGAYKVGNVLDETQDPPPVDALYTTLSSCSGGAAVGDFESTGGTITITGSGAVWSGSFEVTVARRESPKDLLTVTGSFTGLPLH